MLAILHAHLAALRWSRRALDYSESGIDNARPRLRSFADEQYPVSDEDLQA